MSRKLLLEKENLYKVYDDNMIYISRKDYSAYKNFECNIRAMFIPTLLVGVCVDYFSDYTMCYARMENFNAISSDVIEYFKLNDLGWLAGYIRVARGE